MGKLQVLLWVAIVGTIAVAGAVGYAIGRASIAMQCEQNQAFAFAADVWECTKLRQRTFDVDNDNSDTGVNL